MFPHVAWFEFRYQLKSPVFWVGCLIFFLLTYGSITVDQVQIGSLGNVHKNSPYAIVQTLAIMCVFAVFIIVAVVANVVIRDDDTGFAPIVRTTRVSKADYLVGRFVGATAAAFLVLASVPLGILVGSWMPWIDSEKLGPNHIVYYAHALLAFGLPVAAAPQDQDKTKAEGPKKPALYDPKADAKAQVEAATARARTVLSLSERMPSIGIRG